MLIALHKNARTTPAVRAEIAASDEPASILAQRFGITEQTVYKWKKRDVFADRSHTAHRLQTVLTPAQETVVVHLRRTLLLPLDDLLAVTREFICPHVSRSGLDRCLRRHGAGNLNALKPQEPAVAHKAFKSYEPGYVHMDVKYLPQMQDESSRRYLFVAIDRATRWVFVQLKSNKTAASAQAFLKALHKACPIRINKLLTDNGKEFTDRLFASKEREPSGNHEFDQLCRELGIEHRLTKPRTPRTNGMVERFNGRIADVLKTHRFNSREDMEETLLRYVALYNHQLPQSALKSSTPMQAMKDWYQTHPHLFHKRPYDRTGCDTYLSKLDGTLMSFAIFALAFVARPLGTALSMAVQRRWGRATKLTLALFLLGVCTVGMAFLPSYQQAGVNAIIALAVLRVGQGIALGGSWDGLPSLLAMSAPKNRRGWYSMMGQLGAPLGFVLAAGLFAFIYAHVGADEFLSWGWRYPFCVAFAINVVALFARLRLVVGQSYTELLQQRELEPMGVLPLMRDEGRNVVIGAFAALASFALFHLVTIFPLSWISLYSDQAVTHVLGVQIVGAFCAAAAIMVSGWLADRVGRRNTLGTMACLIGIFSFLAPWLLGSGTMGNNVFIIVGFILLGLSYGQAAGTVTSNFPSRYRYTGAALSSDMAWLVGAAFAPLVALGVSSRFGLVALGIYLLSGALCTLAALGINRAIEARD